MQTVLSEFLNAHLASNINNSANIEITKSEFFLILLVMNTKYEDVLNFWFTELTPDLWFAKDDDLDNMMRKRFKEIHGCAEKGELFHWRDQPEGRLAEILLLDQFSRNIYRGRPDAFRNDPMALVLAQEMIIQKLDQKVEPLCRKFIYMPLMHSESRLIHETFMPLFEGLGDPELLHYEILHKEIIDKFGRFPHRNKVLSRASSLAEEMFLMHHAGF